MNHPSSFLMYKKSYLKTYQASVNMEKLHLNLSSGCPFVLLTEAVQLQFLLSLTGAYL